MARDPIVTLPRPAPRGRRRRGRRSMPSRRRERGGGRGRHRRGAGDARAVPRTAWPRTCGTTAGRRGGPDRRAPERRRPGRAGRARGRGAARDRARRGPGQGRAPRRAAVGGRPPDRRSTAASCASARTSPTGRSATGSSCPRATPRSGCTRCWRWRGYFPVEELDDVRCRSARGCRAIPDMTRLPGLDMSTGSLGHGLSAAARAWPSGPSARAATSASFVMLGDGECQEGQVWEAAIVAARVRAGQPHGHRRRQRAPAVRLGRPRRRQRDAARGRPTRLAAHLGGLRLARPRDRRPRPARRSSAACARPCVDAGPGQPTVVLAATTKGRGVSFMEDRFEWHARVPTADEAAAALAELGA